jgi:hypothetical protein
VIFIRMISKMISERCHLLQMFDYKSGSSSVVERQLPKLNVAGSIPVSRSITLPAQHLRYFLDLQNQAGDRLVSCNQKLVRNARRHVNEIALA